MKHTFRPLVPALLVLSACNAAPAADKAPKLAPIAPAPARGTEPMTNESALVLYSAGADALFADPRDAGLHRAFGTLDERLLELVDGESETERGRAITLLASAFAGPLALRIDVPDGGSPPVRGQIELGRDPARAAALERELGRFLADMGVEGMPTPMGPLEHGVVDERVVLSIGGMHKEPLGLGSMDLPAGVEPAFAMKLDLARAWPLMQMAMAEEPEAEQMLGFFTGMGIFGEDALGIRFAFGTGDGVGHVAMRTSNYVAMMEKTGALERAPITGAEIGLVPADAISAAIAQSDPSAVLNVLEMLREPMGGDPIEMIDAMTGVHLRRDVFDHLGTTAGWYTSDSTGGGGMMSFVMFVEVKDEDDLRATLDYGLKSLNDLAAMEADGHVEMRDWMHGEALCTSLTFPGLPIPLELSFSVDDGFLFFTLSPQALTAALDQRAARGLGLAANPRFRAAARGSLDNLVSLSFTDTVRRAQDGYGLATLLTAAFANGVRSPEDLALDPGIVLPPFRALVGPSQASVLLGRIEGGDLVQTGTCDPSLAANMTALCGSPLVYAIGLGMAALVPAGIMMMNPMMMGGPMMYSEPVPYDSWDDESYEEMDEDEMLEMLEGLGYVGDTEETIGEETAEEPVLEDAKKDDPR